MTTMKKIFSMRKIKFLLATIMMLVGVTATHAEDITSDIRINVSTYCTDDNGTVASYIQDEYTVKEGVVVTFRCLKSWDETVTIYLNGTAVATWPGDAGGSEYVWTAKKDAKINWKGYAQSSANIYLTETSTVDVTGITLDPATANMTVGGETLTLTPTVLPDNATDKTVTWTTSNASVATVANGVVTAVAPGTATITVTTTDGAKTATCTVTVAEPTYTVTVKEGTEDAANWTITPTSAKAGETVTIIYNGTKKVKSVKAVKKAATIPVTAITLNKTAISTSVGSTETLTATVTPDDATDQTVIWSSDNVAVASVDALTGEVTAVATGTANITATANDGSGVTATCAVTVTPAISFNKVSWYSPGNAPANFISVSQTDAKAAADAEKTRANAPGYVCIYALEGGSYKWFDSHGRSGQGSSINNIVNDAWDEINECDDAGDSNSIWFTVSQ